MGVSDTELFRQVFSEPPKPPPIPPPPIDRETRRPDPDSSDSSERVHFFCRKCGERLSAKAVMGGCEPVCSECGYRMRIPEKVGIAQDCRAVSVSQLSVGDLVPFALTGELMGATAAFVATIVSAHYLPISGRFVETFMAKPWSPVRWSLVPIHAFAFVPIGMLLNAAILAAARDPTGNRSVQRRAPHPPRRHAGSNPFR